MQSEQFYLCNKMPRARCVVGKDTAAIKSYIANQLKQDQESDQLSMFDNRDPFTGSR